MSSLTSQHNSYAGRRKSALTLGKGENSRPPVDANAPSIVNLLCPFFMYIFLIVHFSLVLL